MLSRQRVLLEMLRQANRPVTKLELVKWAFLLRKETESGGGSSFYQFVPYHYGPYSFAMTREIEALADTGYVRERENCWELGSFSCDEEKLPAKVSLDVLRIIRRLEKKQVSDVIGYVYRTYPTFTVNSKRERLAPRKSAVPQVYTAGYEGLQIDGFLNLLVQSGIERLLDVRRNPVARRYGFHKSTLTRLCVSLGISYEHIPELGIASEERRSLESAADYLALFETYERRTLTMEKLAVERIARLVIEKPSVLVCMEANPCFCHRSYLAAAVARMTRRPIVHLDSQA